MLREGIGVKGVVVRQRFFTTLMVTLLLLSACQGSSRALPTIELSFLSEESDKAPQVFSMEVVATPDERSQGLMFRKHLNPDEGMIFVFPEERLQSFWMKNTYIPLDMVFVSKELRVVGILENTTPLTETPRRVDLPSMYVLEFAGGTAKKFGITEGVRVAIRGDLPVGR